MDRKIDLTKINKEELTGVINRLVYENYKYNRKRSPNITPEGWQTVFGLDAILFEIEYQKELNNK
jgi:hypothetical protein